MGKVSSADIKQKLRDDKEYAKKLLEGYARKERTAEKAAELATGIEEKKDEERLARAEEKEREKKEREKNIAGFRELYPTLTDEQVNVLANFITTDNLAKAASMSGLSKGLPYRWMRENPEFAEAYYDADQIIADELEQVGYERAKEKSDLLLIFKLKGKRPGKYNDKLVTVRLEERREGDRFLRRLDKAGVIDLDAIKQDAVQQEVKLLGKGNIGNGNIGNASSGS